MCHECSFTTAVRDRVLAAKDLPTPTVASTADCDFDGWWLHYIQGLPKEKRRTASGIITYIIWGVWKERNRRVFSNLANNVVDVVQLVRGEIDTRALAFTDDPGDEGS